MEYIIDHIPKNTPNNRRPGTYMAPSTITIHGAANPTSKAKNERGWLTNPTNNRKASYHYVVDAVDIIEVIPSTEVAYHSGDSEGNRSSIGVEICEINYDQSLSNAVKFIAKMLNDRGWGVDRLRRHHDWSGKNCPRLMNNDGRWSRWEAFKNEVQAELKRLRRYKVNPDDANKIIKFLGVAWELSSDEASKNEFNRLANELRKASNQSEQ